MIFSELISTCLIKSLVCTQFITFIARNKKGIQFGFPLSLISCDILLEMYFPTVENEAFHSALFWRCRSRFLQLSLDILVTLDRYCQFETKTMLENYLSNFNSVNDYCRFRQSFHYGLFAFVVFE